MQRLYLEEAWKRTVSEKDREMIENAFDHAAHEAGKGVMMTYLRHAHNHRSELLYTVLIHNYCDNPYLIKDKQVTLLDNEGHAVYDTFTVPVAVPPRSSMPWTFIFPSADTCSLNAENAVLML